MNAAGLRRSMCVVPTSRLNQRALLDCNNFAVGVGADRKPFGLSDENVLYDSAESASQAFDEIRDAVDRCPTDRFVASKVAGVPRLKWQLALIPDDQLGDLAPDHAALSWTATDDRGNSNAMVAVFQRRGRVMVILYGV